MPAALPCRPVVLLCVLIGCGPRIARVPAHPVFAESGALIERDGPVRFGVVGGTAARGAEDRLAVALEDLRAADLDFAVLTGGIVRRSTTAAWGAFDAAWTGVSPGGVLAVPGVSERRGDRQLRGFASAFAGSGATRGATPLSWWHFDLDTDGGRWRFVMLDADRGALGDQWDDQLFWVPKIVSGTDFDHLVVVMGQPLLSLTESAEFDPEGGPATLLGVIRDHAHPTRLLAVLMGGSASNELYLHSGPFGAAHVVAGTVAGPTESLARWGRTRMPGFERIALVDGFDEALLAELTRWSDELGYAESVVEHAQEGEYPGDQFPIRGWWRITLQGKQMALAFRMIGPDGTFREIYRIVYTRSNGWIADRGQADRG